MRVIGTITNENDAFRFTNYLTSQGVANTCEISFETQNGHMLYQVWIHDEDKIAFAADALVEFQKQPSNPKFDAPIPVAEVTEPSIQETGDQDPENAPPPHRFKNYLTNFILALCVFVYFLNFLQLIPLKQDGMSERTFMLTPIQARFMYDLPAPFAELDTVIQQYELETDKTKGIPPGLIAQVQAANKAPFWRGGYDWIVNKIKGTDPSIGEGPLFGRIREGEIWRLISPVILHSDLLHILFNMMWLWYLGRPVEQRIGPVRTLLLSLIIGVGSNTIQYLISGPFFIGYSGIITGLAGFIWMREKIAPWEGYPLNRATILFLIFFIAAIFVIQMVAFGLQIFTTYQFSPNIANSAHIAGAVIGAILGRAHFFAQRVHK